MRAEADRLGLALPEVAVAGVAEGGGGREKGGVVALAAFAAVDAMPPRRVPAWHPAREVTAAVARACRDAADSAGRREMRQLPAGMKQQRRQPAQGRQRG